MRLLLLCFWFLVGSTVGASGVFALDQVLSPPHSATHLRGASLNSLQGENHA